MLQQIRMNANEFKPLAQMVLIKTDRLVMEEKTSFGLIVKSEKSVVDRPISGTVLAVGKDVTQVEVGDYVVYPRTDGIDLKFLDSTALGDEVEYVLVRENSLTGKKAK
jgi:co-chaperonin GroES (HSP10)